MACNCSSAPSTKPPQQPPILPQDRECLAGPTCSPEYDESCVECPTSFCDPRLKALPQRTAIPTVLSIINGCLVRLADCGRGVLFRDKEGQSFEVTDAPRFNWPVLRNFMKDSQTGRVITDGRNAPMEGSPPDFDLLSVGTVADDGITQNYIRGESGQEQIVVWNGGKYEHRNRTNDRSLFDMDELGLSQGCGVNAVFVEERCMEIIDGQCVETKRLRLAREAATSSVGDIVAFGGPTEKLGQGKLPCDGTLYSITEYPDLFSKIGYRWGGQGSQFRVPDLRDRFLRGRTSEPGEAKFKTNRMKLYEGGVEIGVGSYQGHAFQAHGHYGRGQITTTYAWLRFTGRTTTVGSHGSKSIAYLGAQANDLSHVMNASSASLEGTISGHPVRLPAVYTDWQKASDHPEYSQETRPVNAMVEFYIVAGCTPETQA